MVSAEEAYVTNQNDETLTIVNLKTPGIADSDTVKLSMFIFRRVKTMVMRVNKPMWFSV